MWSEGPAPAPAPGPLKPHLESLWVLTPSLCVPAEAGGGPRGSARLPHLTAHSSPASSAPPRPQAPSPALGLPPQPFTCLWSLESHAPGSWAPGHQGLSRGSPQLPACITGCPLHPALQAAGPTLLQLSQRQGARPVQSGVGEGEGGARRWAVLSASPGAGQGPPQRTGGEGPLGGLKESKPGPRVGLGVPLCLGKGEGGDAVGRRTWPGLAAPCSRACSPGAATPGGEGCGGAESGRWCCGLGALKGPCCPQESPPAQELGRRAGGGGARLPWAGLVPESPQGPSVGVRWQSQQRLGWGGGCPGAAGRKGGREAVCSGGCPGPGCQQCWETGTDDPPLGVPPWGNGAALESLSTQQPAPAAREKVESTATRSLTWPRVVRAAL